MHRSVVLVHGSWHGGWGWDAIIHHLSHHLSAKGHAAYAPRLPGHGPGATHVGITHRDCTGAVVAYTREHDRHGETAWTISRQHTDVADLPLTAQGEAEAVRLGERLEGLRLAAVLTSPLQQAVRTCELAGFGSMAEVEPDLLEWNCGAYEGCTTADISAEPADWDLFRDGCPEGQSPDQIGARTDRVARRVRGIEGDVLLFSSGHFPRVFAARWLGLEPGAARYFFPGTASLSAVGYEHDRSTG